MGYHVGGYTYMYFIYTYNRRGDLPNKMPPSRANTQVSVYPSLQAFCKLVEYEEIKDFSRLDGIPPLNRFVVLVRATPLPATCERLLRSLHYSLVI